MKLYLDYLGRWIKWSRWMIGRMGNLCVWTKVNSFRKYVLYANWIGGRRALNFQRGGLASMGKGHVVPIEKPFLPQQSDTVRIHSFGKAHIC